MVGLIRAYKRQLSWMLALTALTAATGPLGAATLQLAVASNFAAPMQAIAARFEAQTGHQVRLALGSTGKHYAQICHGAPFDAFFAADVARPQLLENAGIAMPGSRFTYAIGKLVLWSRQPGMVDAQGKILHSGTFRHLAIAHPELAPYGRAAAEVMQARGVWQQLQTRIVRGENINQALHFTYSGNADLGFVALAQLKHAPALADGSFWQPPQALYRPIEQQAVLLNDSALTQAFASFMQGSAARAIIHSYGYTTP